MFISALLMVVYSNTNKIIYHLISKQNMYHSKEILFINKIIGLLLLATIWMNPETCSVKEAQTQNNSSVPFDIFYKNEIEQ